MNETSKKNTSTDDGQINTWELMEHILSGWRWIATGGSIGLMLAIVFVLQSPTLYEATATIQPATIGPATIQPATIGTASSAQTPTPVEPLGYTLERLKLASFYSDEIVDACHAKSARTLEALVKIGPVKGNNLISIGYRAESGAEAETCLAKIIEELARSQATIAAPLLRELEDQLAVTKQQIDITERFLAQNDTALLSQPGISVLLMLKRDELIKLQKSYREQRIQLTPPFTQPLKLLSPIYTAQKVGPAKKALAVAGSLIGGLCIGLFALLANRSWKRYRSAKA